MWCPNGHGEYQPHVPRCIDCGALLVECAPLPIRRVEIETEPEPKVPVEVMPGVGRDVDGGELGLLLRAAEVDHFWSGDDLVVPADRLSDVGELLTDVGPPPTAATTSSALRRALTPGPKMRAFLVWGPSIAALWYSSATLETKRQGVDGLFSDLWKALAVYAMACIVVGALTLGANWERRFHRRALWLLLASVCLLAGTAFV